MTGTTDQVFQAKFPIIVSSSPAGMALALKARERIR